MNERICEIEGCTKLGAKKGNDYRLPRCSGCNRLTRLGLLPKPNRYPSPHIIKTLSIRQQARLNRGVTDSSNAV